jgi:hypothetical protein
MTPRSPVPQEVSTELERVVRRWRELPVDRALARVPVVRALVNELAERTAPGHEVPDLGPAVLIDQLRVVVHDACAAADSTAPALEQRLAQVRRAL